MSEIARINTSFVDWSSIKRSLDAKTCIRREHATGECGDWHYTEAQAFSSLSRKIKEIKQTLEILREFRRAASKVRITQQCELHWIQDCAICSPVGRIDRSIKAASVEHGKLKFRLISLPTVAHALGRDLNPSDSGADALRPEPERPPSASPIERIYRGFSAREQNTPTRLRQSDIEDNVRLIEAWLRERAA